jgi:hypothetical protein
MCVLLETAIHHTIEKHFNFVGDSVPQGPLAYGIQVCVRAYGTGDSVPRNPPGLRHSGLRESLRHNRLYIGNREMSDKSINR